MIRYLLDRPIGVFIAFLSLSIMGIFALYQIPTTLLPDIDIPTIIIKTRYPNASNQQVEQKITGVLRDNLKSLKNLEKLETLSSDFSSEMHLIFKHGTKMDLAVLEVNEKIDLLSNMLPRNTERPRVIKVNTSDVPIARLNLIPSKTSLYELSDLTEKVIRKRLEQIEGVSLVDISGSESVQIAIAPKQKILESLGLTENDISSSLKFANSEYGSLSVKDGEYRYFLKVANYLTDIEDIRSLELRLSSGQIIRLSEVADVNVIKAEKYGSHIFNGKQGLVITIHKQANAKMSEVVSNIERSLQFFREDYRDIEFNITQDQSFLLNESIQNLVQDLGYGTIFCIILLLLLIGNLTSPLMMGISIPMSLLLTFVCFYYFKISFNIISLSGLALGIGMLIDNSIIVVENINRKRSEGNSIEESCVDGVNEVISPVVSNVLTTVAIYAPLIFLSGMAGVLVYDQAIALTISLGVSLLVAFLFNPVLYRYLYRDKSFRTNDNTRIYSAILKRYHKMIQVIFQNKARYFIITLFLMPLGICVLMTLPIKTLPSFTETESLVKIDWKTPLTERENRTRILELSALLNDNAVEWEADVGLGQFIYFQDGGGIEKANLYYKCTNEETKVKLDGLIKEKVKNKYPHSRLDFGPAPNAFTQLFHGGEPYLEARFRPLVTSDSAIVNLKNRLSRLNLPFTTGPGFDIQNDIKLSINESKLLMYDVQQAALEASLNRAFNTVSITSFENFRNQSIVSFGSEDESFKERMSFPVVSTKGLTFPISTFLSSNIDYGKKYTTGDRSGEYVNIIFEKRDVNDIDSLSIRLTEIADGTNFECDLTGTYFSDRKLIYEMAMVFLISMVLIYSILSIQFESLLQPIIVMLTLPLGIGGAMLALWLAGGTINIMTCIGLIIVLGIIVDDPSLKVETMNRLNKKYRDLGMTTNEALLRAMHEAGEICLKPLLLVSLTTSLSMLPVLFMNGIGNELQKPMAFVIIGGLTVGTFFTVWFIPLAYWYIKKDEA